MPEQNLVTLFCSNQQSQHTATNAKYRLLSFARWLESEHQVTDLEAVQVQHILSYKQHLAQSGLAPSSQARELETLRSFFRWCHSEGMIDHDPAKSVKSPRATLNKEPEYLTTDESRKLFDMTDRTDKRGLAMLWGLTVGLRVGELTALDVQDLIPPKDGKLAGLRTRGKRLYERTVPLAQVAYTAIADYLSTRHDAPKDSPLFACRYAGESDRRLTTRAVERWFSNLVVSAGLPREKGHPHAARHGFATRLLFEGNTPGSLYTVSKLLGHTNLSTTEKYLHLDRQAMQTAILADPLASAG